MIELLVVIAIVGIVVGLLLSAIQRVRAAADSTSCRNNQKQIGLALHSYHDRMNLFPPGYRSAVGAGNVDLGPGWGWAAFLLPDLEQAGLQRQIDFNLDITHSANASARVQSVAVFLCPSDMRGGRFTPEDTAIEVAHANYVGVFGSNEVEDDPGVGNGVFYRNSATRLADILDGTSNTLLVGERSSNQTLATWTGAVTGADEAPALVIGDTGTLPNSPDADDDDFWSRHPSGVIFLFADGSVRFITNAIEPAVWNGLATRDGGEVAAEP